jgi:hypothetical protein
VQIKTVVQLRYVSAVEVDSGNFQFREFEMKFLLCLTRHLRRQTPGRVSEFMIDETLDGVLPAAGRNAMRRTPWITGMLLLSVAATGQAFTPPAPVITAPATSEGTYTVSYGSTGSSEDIYTLQESSSGGSWVNILTNSHFGTKTFTKTSSGARSYRAQHCFLSNPSDGGDGSTQCSAWSSTKVVQVYIQPSGAPTIGCTGCNAPEVDGDYTITWTLPSGPVTHFRLFERVNGNWQSPIVLATSQLSKTYANKPDGAYQYQVDACNTLVNGNCGTNDSAIRIVTVDATPAPRPSTAVVLGDSFSSGEGGRWMGNSFAGIDGGDRADTDAAAIWLTGAWRYHLDIPYEENSIENFCNRSVWAPITYLQEHINAYPQGFDKIINLACSGARTKHLWPPEVGGVSFKGETPQIPRLFDVALVNDIDLIVIGVGGNDMGFSGAVLECGLAWLRKHWGPDDDNACDDEIRNQFLPKLSDVWFNVTKTIQQTKQQMAIIGDDSYEIVLMGYPAIIPAFNDWAYDAGDRRVKRCPFNGPDSQYVEDVLMPKLNATIEGVADQEEVDFINLHHAFDQHRLCENGLGHRMVEVNTPTSHNTEWVRYLDTTGFSLIDKDKFMEAFRQWRDLSEGTLMYIAGDQGSLSESLHPNMFGQQAIGDCLREYLAHKTPVSDQFACSNNGSGLASDMGVGVLPQPSFINAPTDKPIPVQGTVHIDSSLTAGSEPGGMMRSEIRIDHALKGQLRITITSPSGRVYLVRDFNPSDGGAFPLVSKPFFYDAPAETGTWRLTIEDGVAGTAGTFRDWKAYFY